MKLDETHIIAIVGVTILTLLSFCCLVIFLYYLCTPRFRKLANRELRVYSGYHHMRIIENLNQEISLMLFPYECACSVTSFTLLYTD